MSHDLNTKIEYLKANLEALSKNVGVLYAADITNALVDSVRDLNKRIEAGKKLTRGKKIPNLEEQRGTYTKFIKRLIEIEKELYAEYGLTLKLRLNSNVVLSAPYYSKNSGRFIPKQYWGATSALNIEATAGYIQEYIDAVNANHDADTMHYQGGSKNNDKLPIKGGDLQYSNVVSIITTTKRVFPSVPYITIPYNCKTQKSANRYPRLSAKDGVAMENVVFHMPCQVQVFNSKVVFSSKVTEKNWEEKLDELSSKSVYAHVMKSKAL